MARSNLRRAALRLVHRSADYLSRRFRRRIFPIDVRGAAIRHRDVSEQHRMVRAHAFSFWSRNFSADVADRSLSDVWRHLDRRAFLHGARAHRAKVRHRAGALARDVPCFRATARARILTLLHLAPFQTHAAQCDSRP